MYDKDTLNAITNKLCIELSDITADSLGYEGLKAVIHNMALQTAKENIMGIVDGTKSEHIFKMEEYAVSYNTFIITAQIILTAMEEDISDKIRSDNDSDNDSSIITLILFKSHIDYIMAGLRRLIIND